MSIMENNNKKKDLVSIIVPVYNVEKFLHKCLQSILKQSYHNTEIILVDDGSTDLSGKICDEYALLDNRIHVVHKTNGGLSSARNIGLDIAKGDYLYFVDSDDWIEQNTIEENLKILWANNADMVIFGIIREFSDGSQKKSNFKNNIISTEDIINASAKMDIEPSVWCRLTKKEIFDCVKFPIGLRMEDIYIMGKVLSKCEKIVLNSKCYYHYNLMNTNSITSNKQIVFDSYCLSIAYYEMLSHLINLNIKKDSKKYLCENCIKYGIKALDINLLLNKLNNKTKNKLLSMITHLTKKYKFQISLRYKILMFGIQKNIYLPNYIDGVINCIKFKTKK